MLNDDDTRGLKIEKQRIVDDCVCDPEYEDVDGDESEEIDPPGWDEKVDWVLIISLGSANWGRAMDAASFPNFGLQLSNFNIYRRHPSFLNI